MPAKASCDCPVIPISRSDPPRYATAGPLDGQAYGRAVATLPLWPRSGLCAKHLLSLQCVSARYGAPTGLAESLEAPIRTPDDLLSYVRGAAMADDVLAGKYGRRTEEPGGATVAYIEALGGVGSSHYAIRALDSSG